MNFVLDFQMLYLGLGLLGLVLINILLGSIDGFLQKQFDKVKLINGIIKGSIVTVSFIGVYLIGNLVPDITIEINGQEMTLLMAINVIILGGFAYYAKEVLTKLASFIGVKL